MPLMVGLGAILQIVFIRPLKTDREALSVLVTYALALGIEGVLGYVFTTNFVELRAWYETASFEVFGFHITWVYVFGFALCLTILGALFLMLYRTSFGGAIRATMLNRTDAQRIGLDGHRLAAIALRIRLDTAAHGCLGL